MCVCIYALASSIITNVSFLVGGAFDFQDREDTAYLIQVHYRYSFFFYYFSFFPKEQAEKEGEGGAYPHCADLELRNWQRRK